MKKITKRDVVKQLIGRESVYRVSDFARKVSKKLDKEITRGDITGCLSHLQTEGKLVYCLSGQHVIGSLC